MIIRMSVYVCIFSDTTKVYLGNIAHIIFRYSLSLQSLCSKYIQGYLSSESNCHLFPNLDFIENAGPKRSLIFIVEKKKNKLQRSH